MSDGEAEKQVINQEKFFDLLLKQDEITWQSLLYELVRSEQMDPYDIDISDLTVKYIDVLKKLQGWDCRISGKVVLTAAVLLHMKSTKLVNDGVLAFDKLLHPEDFLDSDDGDTIQDLPFDDLTPEQMTLLPRTPQPRKRKVSIYDLMEALQQALEVKKRRILRDVEIPEMIIPERKVDITKLIIDLYQKIKVDLDTNQKLTFDSLVTSESKEDKIYTFVPLLHLATQRKIDLLQQINFGEIEIKLAHPDHMPE